VNEMKTPRPRVLVIDDDALLRETLRALLVPAGYAVESVESGEEGLRAYRRTPYDCVITDAGLRGVGGLAVARAIKALDPAAHVVLLTGHAVEPEDLEEAGIDRMLTKPARRDDILSAVRRSEA